MLRDYTGGKLITRNVGQAASMASYIMLAGDEVEAYDNTTYMIHNGITWAFGNHHDLRDTADTLEALTMMLANKYVEKTGKDIKEIRDLLDNESYFFGNEMLEHGFVDRILNTDKRKDRASSVALASEQFKACKASTQEHHGDIKPEKMAAVSKNYADKAKGLQGNSTNKMIEASLSGVRTKDTKSSQSTPNMSKAEEAMLSGVRKKA